MLRRRAQLAEPDLATPLRDPQPPERPWWGNPGCGSAVASCSWCSGIYVWPGLFGGTFLFLPFIWVWRPRRGRGRRPADERPREARTRLPGCACRAARSLSPRRRCDSVGEVADDRRGFAFAAPEVVVGALHDHDLGHALAVGPELVRGAVLVVLSREEQRADASGAGAPPGSAAEGARGRSVGAGSRTSAKRAHPLVLERLSERDARAERPARTRASDPRRARARHRSRLARRAARPGRRRTCRRSPSMPRKLKTSVAKLALPGELVPDGPQDRVILAPAVARVRVTDHRRSARRRRRAGGARPPGGRRRRSMNVTGSIASATMPAMGELRQPVGTAFTIRDPCRGPTSRRSRARASRSATRPCSSPRSARATRWRRSMGLAGETSALLLGTGVIPMPREDAQARGDGGRDRPGALGRPASPRRRDGSGRRRGRSTGSGPTSEEIRDTDRRRALTRRRPPAPAPGSRPDLDRGARSEGGPSRRRDRRRRDPQLVHAGARGGGPRRDPERGRESGPRPGLGHDRGLRARRVLRSCGRGARCGAAAEYASYPAYARQFEAMGVEPPPGRSWTRSASAATRTSAPRTPRGLSDGRAPTCRWSTRSWLPARAARRLDRRPPDVLALTLAEPADRR